MRYFKMLIALIMVLTLIMMPAASVQAAESEDNTNWTPDCEMVEIYLIMHNGYVDTPVGFAAFDYEMFKNYSTEPAFDYILFIFPTQHFIERLSKRNLQYAQDAAESIKIIEQAQKDMAKSLSVYIPNKKVIGIYLDTSFKVWSNYDDEGKFNFTWRDLAEIPPM